MVKSIYKRRKKQQTQERNAMQEELETLHILSSVINLENRGQEWAK